MRLGLELELENLEERGRALLWLAWLVEVVKKLELEEVQLLVMGLDDQDDFHFWAALLVVKLGAEKWTDQGACHWGD